MAKKKKPIQIKKSVVGESVKAAKPDRAKSKPSKTTAKRGVVPGSSEAAAIVRPIPVVANFQPTPEHPYLIERLLTPQEVSLEYQLRREELDKGFKQARTALRKWLPSLRKQPQFKRGHITGWSVTFRRSFGHVVSPLQVAIAINVATKFAVDDLEHMKCTALPKSVFGIPIKVLEGSFVFLASALQGVITRASGVTPHDPLPLTAPLIGGVPVAPDSDPTDFGTLGIVVEETTGEVVGVTNFHVIDSGAAAVKLGPTFSPGSPGGTAPVGKASTTRRVLGGKSGLSLAGSVDCAAIILEASIAAAALKNAVRELTHLKHTLDPANIPLFYANRPVSNDDTDLPVWKFGARSGIKLKGRIQINAGADVKINGKLFRNIIVVQHDAGNNTFVPAGDSGSVMVLQTKVKNRPAFVVAGIFFAQIEGNDSKGIACHFSDVKQALDLRIKTSLLADDWSPFVD